MRRVVLLSVEFELDLCRLVLLFSQRGSSVAMQKPSSSTVAGANIVVQTALAYTVYGN